MNLEQVDKVVRQIFPVVQMMIAEKTPGWSPLMIVAVIIRVSGELMNRSDIDPVTRELVIEGLGELVNRLREPDEPRRLN